MVTFTSLYLEGSQWIQATVYVGGEQGLSGTKCRNLVRRLKQGKVRKISRWKADCFSPVFLQFIDAEKRNIEPQGDEYRELFIIIIQTVK